MKHKEPWWAHASIIQETNDEHGIDDEDGNDNDNVWVHSVLFFFLNRIPQKRCFRNNRFIAHGSEVWLYHIKAQQIQCLLRTLLPIHRWHLLAVSSRCKEPASSLGLFNPTNVPS